jgi:hypothetical protein
MTENMKYSLISGSTAEELKTKVNQQIPKEWRPQGGICVTGVPGIAGIRLKYVQDMIKN